MKNTIAVSLFLSLAIGCSDAKEEEAAAADTGTEPAEDNWWEDDETPDDDEEPDDDDDDDDDKPDDSFFSIEFGLSLATGAGGFEGHYGECEFAGAIVDAAEVEACGDCSMSMSMTLESVSFTGEGCDDVDDLRDMEGSTETLGHGAVELIDIEGLSIHALYGFDEGETPEWAAVDGGYSLLVDGMWYFGIEL